MSIYLITLLVVCLCSKYASEVKNNTISTLLLFVSFSTMIFVAGLRDWSIGTDSIDYVRYFERVETFADSAELAMKTKEYGYWTLSWLVHRFSGQYIFLFLSIALVVVSCYQRTILKYSYNSTISFYVFITLGFYTFFFNGARQGLACAICALAVGPLIRSEFKKYVVVVLVATLFHKTALIMLPLYFLLRKKNTLRTNALFGVLALVAALSLPYVVDTFSQYDSRYQGYGASGEGGGFLMSAFNIVLWLFFYVFQQRASIGKRQYYSVFLNMLFFSAVISLTSIVLRINPSGILRLTVYFNIGAIFLLPLCYESFSNRLSKKVFISVTGVFLVVYFVMTTSSFGQLVPYALNNSLSIL